MNIYDLISRAQKLRKETQLDSVSPDRVGGLHEDTLKYINEFQLLASSPSLHKAYASVSAMQSDKSPKSDLTGKPLKPGQLVVIVPANQTDATAGDVYRYDGPSGNTSAWTFVAKIGAVPADAELSATSTNPPQNKVVTEKLTELESEFGNCVVLVPSAGATWQLEDLMKIYSGKKVVIWHDNPSLYLAIYKDSEKLYDLTTTPTEYDLTNYEDGLKVFLSGTTEQVSVSVHLMVDSELKAELSKKININETDIKRLRMDVGFDMFAYDTFDGYIDKYGEIDYIAVGRVTQLYPVKEGDIMRIKAGWQNQTEIGLLWGYSDTNGANPQMLVQSKTIVDETITIPQGVNYIRAWSDDDPISPSCVIVNSLLGMTEENVSKINDVIKDINSLGSLSERLNEVIYDVKVDDYDGTTKNNAAGNKFYLISKNPIPQKGVLHKVTFYATSATSKAYLVICTLSESNLVTTIKDFILLSATQEGENVFDVSINVNAGDYIGLAGDKANDFVQFGSKATDNGWYWTSGYTTEISKGGRVTTQYLPNYTLPLAYEVRVKDYESKEITTHKIVATRNADDYNSIRELVDSITDASEYNRYQIIIPRGRWFESDLRGKKWVELIGEDREESILYCDGTSDKITPPNYAYGDYSNMPLNTISSIYKHVFFVTEDLNISNLTIEAKSCKYCIHPDSAYFDSVSVKNCHLIGDSVNAIVGIGLHGGQEIVFDSCIFENKELGLGIYCHNWNNQSKGSSLTIQNSLFRNVAFISLGELGSEQVDRINLINNVFGANVTKDIGIRVETNAVGASFWKNPNTGENETNLDNVPYCLYVNTCGTSISKINATNRDKFEDSYFIGNTSES